MIMNWSKYQLALFEAVRNTNDNLVIAATAGSGKCLGKDTPVLMFDGTVKPVQDVVVGDVLMGWDSTPRNVLALGSGTDTLYRVTPVKGDSWVCNSSHVLTLYSSDHKYLIDIPVNEYLELSKYYKKDLKLLRTKANFASTEIDFVSPYLLGTWLGDGHTRGSDITSNIKDVSIVVAEIEKNILKLNDESVYCKVLPEKSPNCKKISIRSTVYGNNQFRAFFRNNCVNNNGEKSIPHNYLCSSRNNRLELLAGIIDTDGHYSGNHIEISTKLKGLSDQYAFLCRSLGLAAYVSVKTVNGKDYYRVNVSGDYSIVPTRTKRRDATKRKQIKNVLVTGFSLANLGEGDYYGFEIDGDGRFLLGDFTITHNTSSLVEVANIINQSNKSAQSVFLAFNKSIQRELEERLPGGFESRTINSFGFGFLRNISKFWKIDAQKYNKLSQYAIEYMYPRLDRNDQYLLSRDLTDIVNMTRNNNIDLFDEESFWQMVFNYGLNVQDGYVEAANSILIAGEYLASDRKEYPQNHFSVKILNKTRDFPKRFIDYTDQVWLPIIWNLVKPVYDIILVDEAQDLNAVQLEMILQAINHTGRLVAVGDRRQSIYSFAGADHNSIDNIIARTNAVELPLSITYRCPLKHVELAKQIDPTIEAAPNAKDGFVGSVDESVMYKAIEELYNQDESMMLLCRTNAPLVKAALSLLANRLPAQVRGRDIGGNIINIIEKLAKAKTFDFDRFHEIVYEWYLNERDKMLKKRAKEAQIQTLNDKYETIIALYDGINPSGVDNFVYEIKQLFTDEKSARIICSSVHKSKGLESENIFILKPDKLPLIWKNQSENDFIQEMNIKFVALTRSKNRLIFVNDDTQD